MFHHIWQQYLGTRAYPPIFILTRVLRNCVPRHYMQGRYSPLLKCPGRVYFLPHLTPPVFVQLKKSGPKIALGNQSSELFHTGIMASGSRKRSYSLSLGTKHWSVYTTVSACGEGGGGGFLTCELVVDLELLGCMPAGMYV